MDYLVLNIFKLTILIQSILLVTMGYMIKYAIYFAVSILGIILLIYWVSKRIEEWMSCIWRYYLNYIL